MTSRNRLHGQPEVLRDSLQIGHSRDNPMADVNQLQ